MPWYSIRRGGMTCRSDMNLFCAFSMIHVCMPMLSTSTRLFLNHGIKKRPGDPGPLPYSFCIFFRGRRTPTSRAANRDGRWRIPGRLPWCFHREKNAVSTLSEEDGENRISFYVKALNQCSAKFDIVQFAKSIAAYAPIFIYLYFCIFKRKNNLRSVCHLNT